MLSRDQEWSSYVKVETTIPLTIAFPGMAHSDAIEALVRQHVSALQRFSSQILHCRVVIELPHKHRVAGFPVEVRIELHMAGGDVVVNHEPSVYSDLQRSERRATLVLRLRMRRSPFGRHSTL